MSENLWIRELSLRMNSDECLLSTVLVLEESLTYFVRTTTC